MNKAEIVARIARDCGISKSEANRALDALLDNVTTVLLIAPVTLLVCDRLALNPTPFLMAEVFASNIGGAATLVGTIGGGWCPEPQKVGALRASQRVRRG